MLEKTLRATQLYLPNNPMYQTALDRLTESFRTFWQTEDEIVLGITGEGFQLHGMTFPNDPDHSENLAWLLYRDGLRAITLASGCEDEELVRLLELINQARTTSHKTDGVTRRPSGWTTFPHGGAEAHEDLLTLLWPQEFLHIQYEFVEPADEEYTPLEETGSMYNLGVPDDVRAQIEDDVECTRQPDSEKNPFATLDDSDGTLHFLDAREIARLKREIDEEYKAELHTNVLAILFDIFETQTYGEPQLEIVEIIEQLLPRLLGLREYNVVAYILREARDISLRASAPAAGLKRLEDIPAKLSSPEVLSGLLQVLDESHAPPARDDLTELLGQLKPESIGTILEWLPRLNNSRVKGVLSLALDPIARANPKRLIQSVASSGPAALTAALDIVSRLALRNVADDVLGFASHEDPTVRKTVALTFASLATAATLDALTQLLFDDDREVRTTAAKKLTSIRHVAACPLVETVIKTRLRRAQLSEKRIFFEAFAVLGGGSAIARLDAMLNTKRLFGRREDPDTRACAAMALGMIGTPPAQTALGHALNDKESIVRIAADKAIRGIRQ